MTAATDRRRLVRLERGLVGEQLVGHDRVGVVGRLVHHVHERARLVGCGRVDQLAQQLEQLGAPARMGAHRRRVGDQLSSFSLSATTDCS